MAYGRGRDSPAQILNNTRRAVADLVVQLEVLEETCKREGEAEAEGEGEGEGEKNVKGHGDPENVEGKEEDNEKKGEMELKKQEPKNPQRQETTIQKEITTQKQRRRKKRGKCYAVPLNSGLFGIPWRQTRKVLEGGELDIVVVGIDPETFS